MIQYIAHITGLQNRLTVAIWTSVAIFFCTGCSDFGPGVMSDNADIWQSMPPLPVSNGGFIVGLVDNQLLVIGGTTWANGNKSWLKGAAPFSIVSKEWGTIQPLAFPVAYAAFGSSTRGVYWLGGSDGTDTWNSFYRITSGSSPQFVSSTGHKVVYAGAAADDEALYIVAGAKDVSDLSTLSDRFLRVSLETGDVDTLPPYPGGAVMLPTVVCVGDEVFVFGGGMYDTASAAVVNVTDAYAYSLRLATWRKLAPLPHARRGMAACRLDGETILIGGGYGSIRDQPREGFANDTLTYRISGDRYMPAADMPYAAMGQALINHRGTLYLMGGEDRPRSRTSAFYVFGGSR